MNGIVIYNSFFGKENKLFHLVENLVIQGKMLGINLVPVGNNEITMIENGKLELRFPKFLTEPDFIIFWDKDIVLAQILEKLGYTVYNSAKSIELCDDKIKTAIALSNMVKMPKTIIGPFSYFEKNFSEKELEHFFDILGKNIIVKESKGSFGMQVYLAKNPSDLKKIILSFGNRPYILQEYISTSRGRDIRVNIVGNKVIGAMERSNPDDFRANITMGGSAKEVELSDREIEIALKAHNSLGLTFSGVDLLYGEDSPILCEVNSNVNYLSFETLTGINMGREILKFICTNQ